MQCDKTDHIPYTCEKKVFLVFFKKGLAIDHALSYDDFVPHTTQEIKTIMACTLIKPESAPKYRTPKRDEYKSMAFFNALMDDAKRALERAPMPEIGKNGNSKIGARGVKAYTLVYSGVAWHDCTPTIGCNSCYAMGFRYMHAIAHRKGKSWLYSYMAREAIEPLEFIIRHEIMEALIKCKRLGLTLAVRIHEAGDFISPEHVAMWDRIAKEFKTAVFWCYTRSDLASDAMRDALVSFAENENVHCRASFDPVNDGEEIKLTRNGLPGAIIVGTKHKGKRKGPEHVKGAVNCPEQLTNGEIGCSDCGLCWNKSKPVIRFWKH